jgi:DNA modification methylase
MNCLQEKHGKDWSLYNGDSCEILKGLPDASVDLSICSPPFSGLYIYSDSEADMGNAASDAEFFKHFDYLIGEWHRVTVPGRLCVVHCKDLPKYANRDDTAGLKDFPGAIVAAFEKHGWSYHSNVTIWKCPVVERERTNNNGLLHKTVMRDRSQCRQGMADFLKVFRRVPSDGLMSDKPVAETRKGVDAEGNEIDIPVGLEEFVGREDMDPRKTNEHPSPFARNNWDKHRDNAESIRVWQRYAEPVWWDIDQMDVLNYKRPGHKKLGDKDERHICPLQLGVIERCVQLWSNPGDVVFTPFAGVGSEIVGALRQGRKGLGVELKAEYFEQAVKNIARAEKQLLSKAPKTLYGDIEEILRKRGAGHQANIGGLLP